MYVKYCENKPKSEYTVAEFIDFFEVKNIMPCSLSSYTMMIHELLPFFMSSKAKVQRSSC